MERLRLTSPGHLIAVGLSLKVAFLDAGTKWRGEGDVNGEAAVRLGTRPDGGRVGRGDGADDGQAEARAAIAAGWARAEPLPHPRGITLR